MSYEAKYNPLDLGVPNIVTAWNEVDVPTGAQYTLNNPDTSAVGNVVVPYACKADLVNSAIVPLSDVDLTRKRLFDGPASGAEPLSIKTYAWQGIVGKIPATILTGLKSRAGIRAFSSDAADFLSIIPGENDVTGKVNISLSLDGILFVVSSDLGRHEIYLDIIYS